MNTNIIVERRSFIDGITWYHTQQGCYGYKYFPLAGKEEMYYRALGERQYSLVPIKTARKVDKILRGKLV
jgi:hypothetical protein